MELSPQQPGTATPVLAVIPPVTPIVLAVIASVAPVIAAVIPPFVTPAEEAGSIASISEQSHLHAPFIAAWRSASTAAISAWVGIRPLPSSSPPDRRTAEPNGAAQVFSQTSTAAALPGSSDCPDLLDVLLGEQNREVALQRAQLADLAVVGIAQLCGLDRAVISLREHHQVKHPNGVAVDQRLQLGCHLAREVRLVRRESDDQVVDRPELINVDVRHVLLRSVAPSIRADHGPRGGPRGLSRHHRPSSRACDQLGVMFTRVIDDRPRDWGAAVRADMSAQASRRESGAPLVHLAEHRQAHIRELHRRLGVTSRADAVAHAQALGMLDPTESPG